MKYTKDMDALNKDRYDVFLDYLTYDCLREINDQLHFKTTNEITGI